LTAPFACSQSNNRLRRTSLRGGVRSATKSGGDNEKRLHMKHVQAFYFQALAGAVRYLLAAIR
jgi:hypothetical protein